MEESLKLIVYIFAVYLCTYSLVSRICKCVEHHTEYKYRARFDVEWINSQLMKKSGRLSDHKEGNRDA